ncbi:MAG TPA: LPS-assembly protein LptD [Firmicutes bacterium]|nr:LPS-assembly protein LptD [Bacillota bacterium]
MRQVMEGRRDERARLRGDERAREHREERASGRGPGWPSRGQRVARAFLVVGLAAWLVAGLGQVPVRTWGAKAYAQEAGTSPKAVQITAAEGARWEMGQEILEVRGQVTAKYQDLTLYADWLRLDLRQNRLEARGHVRYVRSGQEITADYVLFDLKANQGSLEGARARLELPEKRGTLFVSAPHIGADRKTYTVEQASLTTCDLTTPHYHLDARKVTVYLDDRVVIEGVSYWDFGLPLFYWPQLTIPLRRQSSLELPQVGYSTYDGWFVKMAYSYYPAGWNAHGLFHLDYYARRGFGIGVDHYYRDNPQGRGILSLYYQPNQLTGHDDWTVAWHESWRPDDRFELASTASYKLTEESGEELASWKVDGKAAYRSDRGRFQVSLKQEGVAAPEAGGNPPGGTTGSRASRELRVDGSLELPAQARLEGSAAWRQVQTDEEQERLQYRLGLTQTLPGLRWKAGLEHQFNPNLDQEDQTVDWFSFQRSPYVTFAGSQPISLGWGFRADWEVDLSQVTEAVTATSVNRTWRVAAGLELLNRSWQLRPDLTAQVGASARAKVYGTGDEQASVASRASLIWQPAEALTLTFRHTDQTVFGQSPFYFDRDLPGQLVTLTLDYRRPALTATFTTGYDLFWREVRPVVTEASWTGGKAWQLAGGLVFNPNREGLEAVIGSVRWTPREDRQVEVGFAYAVAAQSWDKLQGRVNLPLAPSWELRSEVQYDGSKQLLTRASVALVRDLHCRNVTFRYDAVEKAAWVQYQINAFPSAQVGVGAGAGGTFLDVQSLRDFLARFASGSLGPGSTGGAGAQ